MKQKGKDILEIGLTVRGFDKKEFSDRMADGSRQHREYSIDEWLIGVTITEKKMSEY